MRMRRSVSPRLGAARWTREALARVPLPVGLERLADRLVLLGRELEFGFALAHLLGVEAGLVTVVDRGEDQPRSVGIEQRDRGGLAARHLAVGVVADQRAVGHRAVDPVLGRG